MRLYEIEPGFKKTLNLKFESVWNKLILTQCSDIIDVYTANKKVFYRGMRNTKDILRSSSHLNRRPRDSFSFFSQLLDAGLIEAGMSAIRSNSYFVNSSISKTSYFGTPYIIFPVNGYEFTWTSQGDIVLSTSDFIKDYRHLFRNDQTYNRIQTIFDKSDNYVNDWPFQFIERSDTLDSVLTKINQFLEKNNQEPIDKLDLIDMNKIKRNLKPNNTNISIPLNKKKEVMLTGKYYAFKANVYQNQIFNLLEIQ